MDSILNVVLKYGQCPEHGSWIWTVSSLKMFKLFRNHTLLLINLTEIYRHPVFCGDRFLWPKVTINNYITERIPHSYHRLFDTSSIKLMYINLEMLPLLYCAMQCTLQRTDKRKVHLLKENNSSSSTAVLIHNTQTFKHHKIRDEIRFYLRTNPTNGTQGIRQELRISCLVS